jgi:hypothetical protein
MFYVIAIGFILAVTLFIAFIAHYEGDHFEENHRFMKKYLRKKVRQKKAAK